MLAAAKEIHDQIALAPLNRGCFLVALKSLKGKKHQDMVVAYWVNPDIQSSGLKIAASNQFLGKIAENDASSSS
ncbi:hypothetical protein N7523_005770 [Penicillium sp. IBT 18751x]|nr:hypothetical protein N7523_005638 [Penicillium sp. IBT 18751x]KAJ6118019.1 hypothetical protein N7523_005770 [Penicillium sp. IBT 18751x]